MGQARVVQCNAINRSAQSNTHNSRQRSYPDFCFSGVAIQVTLGAVDVRLAVEAPEAVLFGGLDGAQRHGQWKS